MALRDFTKLFSSRPILGITSAIGTPNTGVTAIHYGDGRDITTVLTFTALVVGQSANNAAKAFGKLIYTFPSGAHLQTVSYMNVVYTHSTITAIDTGIGSVIGVGAVALLDGTSTFEDYITGQTGSTDLAGGAAVIKTSVATAGALVGISINEVASVKAVYLNIAATWPAAPATDVTATGQITINWIKLS